MLWLSTEKKKRKEKVMSQGAGKRNIYTFFETCTRKAEGEKWEIKLMGSGITKLDIK